MLLKILAPKSHRIRHNILVELLKNQQDKTIKRVTGEDIKAISMSALELSSSLGVSVFDISVQMEALMSCNHAEPYAIENDLEKCMYFCNSFGIGAIAEKWHLRQGRDAGYKTWTIALAYVAIPSTILSTGLGTWQHIRANSLQERIELLEDKAGSKPEASAETTQHRSNQNPLDTLSVDSFNKGLSP